MSYNDRRLIFWLNIGLLATALPSAAISGYFLFLETPPGRHGASEGASMAGALLLPAIIAFFVRSQILSAALLFPYLFLLSERLPAFFEFLGGRTLNSLFHKGSGIFPLLTLYPLYACLAVAVLLWALRKIIEGVEVLVARRRKANNPT